MKAANPAFEVCIAVVRSGASPRHGSPPWTTEIWSLAPGWVWGGLLVLGLGLVGVAVVRGRRQDLPYVAAKGLLSPAERAFFVVLRRAVGEDFQLFAKVRVGDILQVRPGVEGKRRFTAFGKISSKHADFVACDPRTFAVVGVIELDDRSHEREDRRRRDEFFDAAMRVAGVPVLRVAVQRSYDATELGEAVQEAFGEE